MMRTADLFVDPRRLIQHERVQQERLRTVAAQLAREQIREPVAVAPIGDDRYFVLDGAHRSTAAALLGMPEVPCIFVEPVAGQAIDGWTHVVPGLRLSGGSDGVVPAGPGAGPVVATLRIFGSCRQVRALDGSPTSMHQAFHQVGALYRHLPYERVAEPVDGAWCQITWHIPEWQDLVDLVTERGPLPAGVTRFNIDRLASGLSMAA